MVVKLVNTVSQIFPRTAELVDRKLEMAPNRMFQQMTDKTKKKKKQEIFKNFQATTVTNRFNLPPPLPHWIQHTSTRDENRDFGKSRKPLMKIGRGLSAFRSVANLIDSSK